MHILLKLADLFLHLDKHLSLVIQAYGSWTYAMLFGIVFCETGLVVTPILPGDSMLFASGTFAALGALRIELLLPMLWFASVLGDNANYWIGRSLSKRVLEREKLPFVRREYLERAHAFYERHGGKAVIIGKFFPIIRTFVPFVAGVGKMRYRKFLLSNLCGGTLWIGLFVLGGYFFGNIPLVQKHFSLLIMAMLCFPAIPPAVEFLRQRFRGTSPELS